MANRGDSLTKKMEKSPTKLSPQNNPIKQISEEDELKQLKKDLTQLRTAFDASKQYTCRHRCFLNFCCIVTCFLTVGVFLMSVKMYVELDILTQDEFDSLGRG